MSRYSVALAFAGLIACAAPARAQHPGARIINPDGAITVPYQVALAQRTLEDDGKVAVFCGGTVRDAAHVITAAHCLEGETTDAPGEFLVVAGLFQRSDPTVAQVVEVAAITTHPAYRGADSGNDFGILTLAEPLQLTPGAMPFDPPGTVGALAVGAAGGSPAGQALISGWGDVDPDQDNALQPDPLVGAIVNFNADCSAYGPAFDAATMLCAGRQNLDGSFTDTCQGDSGGPLARMNQQRTAVIDLAGIVSFGNGCAQAGFPGIYTRVANSDINARLRQADPPARAVMLAAPAIEAPDVAVGARLTCNPGRWSSQPVFSALWLRAPLAPDGQPDTSRIEVVADRPQIVLRPEDAGFLFACEVRATNAGGSLTALSGGIGPVQPARAGGAQPGGGGGAPVAVSADLAPPTSSFTRRSCGRRTCRLTLKVDDLGGVAGARVRASAVRVSGCARGRKGRKCRRPRTLNAREVAPGVFEIVARGLEPARYRFSATAVDAAGNTQARAAVVTLTVRKPKASA
jgi:hypothetical protein